MGRSRQATARTARVHIVSTPLGDPSLQILLRVLRSKELIHYPTICAERVALPRSSFVAQFMRRSSKKAATGGGDWAETAERGATSWLCVHDECDIIDELVSRVVRGSGRRFEASFVNWLDCALGITGRLRLLRIRCTQHRLLRPRQEAIHMRIQATRFRGRRLRLRRYSSGVMEWSCEDGDNLEESSESREWS